MSAPRRYIALVHPDATNSRVLMLDFPNNDGAARHSIDDLKRRAHITPGAFVTSVYATSSDEAWDTAAANATAAYRALHTPTTTLAKTASTWFVIYSKRSFDSGEFEFVTTVPADRISLLQYGTFADYLSARNQRAHLVDAISAGAALNTARERFMDDLYESFAVTA